MKAFIYRLEGVFKAKTALRDSKAADLARARQKLQDEQAYLDKIKNNIHSVLTKENARSLSPSMLQQRETYVASLKKKRRDQEKEVEIARRDVENCLKALEVVEVERKKYEKHKAREYDAWQWEFRREEEKRLEDVAYSGKRYGQNEAAGNKEKEN